MNNHLKTGGDPRALSDYAVLRDELAKLSHPARPDVDWQSVEKLSLSLFRQNGIELQTLAWYTLARTRIAGITGLNEGLAIMEALVANQWGTLWPQPVHARMEILSGFSQRLQSVLRTLTLGYADLQQVYEAERHLNALRDVLERLELKNASQINELCNFMHNATTRLENMSDNQIDSPAVVLPATATRPDPLIYVAREEQPEPNIVTLTHEPSPRPWKAFLAGVMTMLVVGGAGLWGWQHVGPQPATPVPVSSDESSLTALSQLPPLWRQEYGFVLASRAEPAEADKLKTQWQQYINGNALPPEALGGWHQGMDGLQELTRRLNALDERKGKYLTGSELKSMVFTIMQDFGRSVPVEEQLYQLSLDNSGEPLAPSLLLQTDIYMNQLLNRYMLIRQQKNGL
ncbi:VasL domain-containing protein [Enterobacter soli]|uniref:VasL domain-containing protein n=1 Tax=Enterobacter soli TaxID=885040 RepID=UPI0034CE1A9D